MLDNPYSSPKTAEGNSLPTPGARLIASRMLFAVVAFVSTWLTFFIAYLVNGFGYGYLSAESIPELFTPFIWESLMVASIVSALAAAPLLVNPRITLRNYTILVLICALEYAMAYWFFVAFFEI